MYEMKTAAETLRVLETDKDKGLGRTEAMERKIKYGANKLKDQEKKSVGQMILEQLNDPLILILVVAMAISMMLREFGDVIIIVTVVVLNAMVGIIQEGKAGKAVEALKKISSPQAVVVREGERMKIPAEDLVQGDIVLLEAGNMIPADLRLIETQGVCVEESTLTGESEPVEKDAEYIAENTGDNSNMNMAYMSTYITKGRGKGVVVATGMDTRVGHIADMLHDSRERLTPLQVRLGELGKILSFLAVGICVFLFVVAVLQKRDVGDMLLTSVSLAVAAVPEGLPAIVTIVLALSVSRMVQEVTKQGFPLDLLDKLMVISRDTIIFFTAEPSPERDDKDKSVLIFKKALCGVRMNSSDAVAVSARGAKDSPPPKYRKVAPYEKMYAIAQSTLPEYENIPEKSPAAL